MDIRLLGPFEVRARGRTLPLGGPKQRAVLAMLVLHRGEVVATDRLVDELWGERPPKTVVAYLQNCISRLRATLGRDVIENRRPGYVLHVDPGDIDAVRFEQALVAARALEASERAAALGEALGLWRGPPLADLVFQEFARAEIARLEELRLTALEERLDAELELGRHGEMLGEIAALVSRHPTRERLRYLQMLALYRSGRQREALRSYHEARRELVEGLGLEPGEELRALERMIIGHDPSLGLEVATAAEPDRRKVVVLAIELVNDGGADPPLAAIDQIIGHHGGAVRELLSDAVLAVFASHDDDVLRALRAATEVRSALPAGTQSRMIVERVPASELDAVQRLGHAADLETILIGAEALRVVPAAVDVVPHESGAYRLLRFDSDSEPFARHFETPLVGRLAELDRLESEVALAVRADTARRVVVLGEAGIGKTRLVRELLERLPPGTHVLTARCAAYGVGVALLPCFQILRQVGRLDVALAGEGDADRVAERLRNLSSTDASEGFWAFRRLLESLARRAPLVVVFEDLHWAAPVFLDLVDYLDGWTSAPVLLLCLTRPELLAARPEWRDDALVLEPLSPGEVQTLAATLPGHSSLDELAVDRAVSAAEGNPLFLEQLLASGADSAPGTVPPTLDALITGRLDALPATERAALERAAVTGREFWRAAVEDATPDGERSAVAGALMALVRRRLVHPERSALDGEDGFRFHHALIRDAVYAAIPGPTRAELHESVARSLDGRHVELDELVGHHLEQAALLRDDPALAQEAGARLGAAGLRALKRFDAAAAIDLLGRAIPLLPAEPYALELEWGLATVVKFAGDTAEADRRLDDVASKAAHAGNRVVELRARIEQAYPRLARADLTVADTLTFLDGARAELGAAGDDLGLGRACHVTAAVRGEFQHHVAKAEEAAVEAIRAYARCGFVAGSGATLLATAAYAGPTPAPMAIDRCHALLAEAGTPVWQSFVLPVFAVIEAMDGQFESARRRLEDARASREEFADHGTIVTSWSKLAGEVELLAGKPGAAEEILSVSVAALRTAGDTSWLATNTAWLAEAQYRQGKFADALQSSGDALIIAPPEHLESRSVARRVHAKALAREGRLEEARALALETVELLLATDALNECGEAHAAAAEVLALAGDDAVAEGLWVTALRLFEAKGNTASIERIRTEREEWGKPV